MKLKWARIASGVLVVVGVGLLKPPLVAAAASNDPPLAVTPYSGFSPTLTRAPYVTDLTQTSAYVNWATNSRAPGSLQFSPMGAGGCPASITTWSASANPLPVPTRIPYEAPPSTATTTAWSFTVVNGAATTVPEYQASVLLQGLSPGATYCYAVFSTDKSGATDLLAPSTNPRLGALRVQSFTTLTSPNASSTTPVKFDVIDDTGENYEDTTQNGASADVPFNASGRPVNPDEASLYQQIGQSGAQFLLDAGDTGYNDGTQTNFGDLEQTGTTTDVSNVFGPSYFPLAEGIPTFSASGDHNQNNTALKVFPTPTDAAASGGSYAYAPVTNVDGITGSAPADWYAFSTGNVRVYVIDGAWGESAVSGRLGATTGSLCGASGTSAATNCRPYQADYDEHWQTSSAEYRWLAADLASPAYSGMVKFAVFHFPLRSDDSHQPSDLYVQNSAANPHASTSLEALLAKNGVTIAFNGHAHIYQRTVPKGTDQIVSYVIGGGGGVLQPVQGTSTTLCKSMMASATVYAIGWSASSGTTGGGSYCGQEKVTTPTSIAQVYDFLQVTVSGGTITVSPTNAAGQIFDQQTYSGPSPPPSPPPSSSPVSLPLTAPCSSLLPAGTVAGSAALPDGSGYDEVDRSGDVATFGAATCYGSITGPLNRPIVGMAATPDGKGYWLVASDGGIFSFGDASFFGSTGAIHLNQPIVGMAPTPEGSGYWLVASDGGVFAYGSARFYGSTGAIHLNQPVVGMAVDSATGGYWLVASDGGVFSYDAPFLGSTGAIRLNQPVVGMMAARDGTGYRLVASDGGVFCYNQPFFGSTGALRLNQPVVGGVSDNDTGGYWLTAADGGVFSFNAPFFGSAV